MYIENDCGNETYLHPRSSFSRKSFDELSDVSGRSTDVHHQGILNVGNVLEPISPKPMIPKS